MVALHRVDTMLARAGLYNKYWGRAAVRELCGVLWDDEAIIAAVNGRYEAGWALLVATEHRLLLIDKKLWYLTIEDIRYDMLAEVDYSSGVIDAIIKFNTFNKSLAFRSVRQNRLRAMTYYVQHQVRRARQNTPNTPIKGSMLASDAADSAGSSIQMPNPISDSASILATKVNPSTRLPFITKKRLLRLPH
jgi:hypothetical protein